MAPGVDRNEHRNLLGKFLIRISGEADFRRAELRAQVSLLLINRAHLLGEKKIDGHARVRLAFQFGQLLLHHFRGIEARVAEFQAGDLERGAIDVKFLDVAVAVRIGDDLMFDGRLQAVRRPGIAPAASAA